MTTQSWAIVTGASGGIGAAFTRALGARRLAVLAVAPRGGCPQTSPGEEVESTRVNVEALFALTRAILPAMVARKRGGILNVASIAAFQAIPYWTTYAATKAFVLSFGEGLAYELRPRGVRGVNIFPGFTKPAPFAN